MIVVRNVAKVDLTQVDANTKALILGMYSYTNSYTGETFVNYKYINGVAYLPPNMDKLNMVAGLLGEAIVDERSKGSLLREPFLLRPELELRGYQVAPAAALVQHALANRYSTLSAGTGTGKTIVMTYAYGHLGGKSLTLVDQSNLVPAWIDAAKLVWGKDMQKLKSGDTEFNDTCIATFQLLAKNEELLSRVSKEFGTAAIDECHVSAAESYRKVLSALDNSYRLSCSASFLKKGFSSQVLSDYLAPVSVIMKNDEALIPEIRWVDTEVIWPATDPMQYANAILPYLATDAKRNSIIFSLAKEAAMEGRIVATICITIKQASFINELLNRCGVKSITYTGISSMKRDREVKRLLESREVSVVNTVGKFAKGTDIVNLDCMIIAKPDNSETRAIQVVGRCTRVLEGKPTPIVYDLRDNGALSETFARGRAKYYKNLGYTLTSSSVT